MLKLKIVTPERVMLETEADSVSLPTSQGEITILPNHIPLVSNLDPGELRYKIGAKEEYFAVSGGFVEVKKTHEVIVLADAAEFGHEIDVSRAERAREKAQRFLTEVRHDQNAYANAAANLQKHLVRIRVAKKHRSRNQPDIHTGY